MYFRTTAVLALVLLAALPGFAEQKLNDDQRIEIMRGLTAEFATAKVSLPRSKKPLDFNQDGTYDKQKWNLAGKELGPAARVGDIVQITKVTIDDDKLLLEINNGLKTRKKWYERVEVGMGNSTRPIGTDQNGTPATGTYIAFNFPKGVPPLTALELKKMLAPILDFEKHSATESFTAQLPPEVQEAIKNNKVIVGMDREAVLLAVGKPIRKTRETKEGQDYEDWIYGQAPGKITFVTFTNSKVVKVKEAYAELGGSTAAPLPVK